MSRCRLLAVSPLAWTPTVCPPLVWMLCVAILLPSNRELAAEESSEESISLYADAANFQTGGALDLAIESWQKFLNRYPKDDLAPKAAHYLGVCYMQRENPDYAAAAKAFERAVVNKTYELREESLFNLGWCYYASAGDGPKRDETRLRKTIETFEALFKQNPKSEYIDRGYFYSGEAAYGLGKREMAIDLYNRFIKSSATKDSPLRCDAFYARGIAQEELDQIEPAIASFREVLSKCADSDLAVDVQLRMGDLLIARKQFPDAIGSFEAAIASAANDDDKSYALFRQAYALVLDGKPNDAATRYDRLQREFPQSPYAANATLASGQSLYRGGQFDEAAKRFENVLGQNDREAATEAAHWLARIKLSQGDAPAAASIARKQIEAGIEGGFAIDLRVDFAEALSLSPDSVAESVRVSEQIYRDAPQDSLASRALYNACFSALQLGDFDKTFSLSGEFLRNYSDDQLADDVKFIRAESQMLSGKVDDAVESYRNLLRAARQGNPQRPLWVLRAATALNAKKDFATTIQLLRNEYDSLPEPDQKAEAQYLVGEARLLTDDFAGASLAFERCTALAPDWPRVAEAKLLQGTALKNDGKDAQAKTVWTSIVASGDGRPMVDQARYKLAQLASSENDHDAAIALYQAIVSSQRDKGLIPFALYGLGWSRMQQGDHAAAIESLDRLLKQQPNHAVSSDALIARGISYRAVGELEKAGNDLEAFLRTDPKDKSLGHALYELALIDQKEARPDAAASRLQQIVREVPNYPDMDKVLYELGWSLRESDKLDEATRVFQTMLQRYPDVALAGEAAYFVGQQHYAKEQWEDAERFFRSAADRSSDPAVSEKSLYRLGWSLFKQTKFDPAKNAFQEQASKHPDGNLVMDATMMVGECAFKSSQYEDALAAYTQGREKIRERSEDSKRIRDPAERQVRELILLHGGQSAAQLKRWDEAIRWYDELQQRFPATSYLPQVFYESGFAHQQKGDNDSAIKFFSQVAERYRNEVAARARFMMGEIYFGEKQFDKAIPEFQRVMFGFGAEKAPEAIKNWQARSGFEAGRCSELLMQTSANQQASEKSKQFAIQFYQYVAEKHADHELAKKSAERLEALQRS